MPSYSPTKVASTGFAAMSDQTRRFSTIDFLLVLGILVSATAALLALAARRAGAQPHGHLIVRRAGVDLGRVDQRENVPFAFTIENETDGNYTIFESPIDPAAEAQEPPAPNSPSPCPRRKLVSSDINRCPDYSRTKRRTPPCFVRTRLALRCFSVL